MERNDHIYTLRSKFCSMKGDPEQMKKTKPDIITLLIQLDKVNKELEELKKPNSETVSRKVKEIYGDRKKH